MFRYYPVTSKDSQSASKVSFDAREFEPSSINPLSGDAISTVVYGAVLGYRSAFDDGGKLTAFALEKHVPNGITKKLNEVYASDLIHGEMSLDVFYPENTPSDVNNPTLIWVHGGGWVSGDKSQIANYLQIIASCGFTVVGVNYSIASESQYPRPLEQVNSAIKYILGKAQEYHIDVNKLGLAGDSAGSQIAAQMATLYTNPMYKGEIEDNTVTGISIGELALNPDDIADRQKLKCIVLCCGGYNLKTLVKYPSYTGTNPENLAFKHFIDTVTVAYSGLLTPASDTKFDTFSVANYVSKDFPASFITVGNVDPLKPQSEELKDKLITLGAPTPTTFFPPEPDDVGSDVELGHEYQFDLDDEHGYGKEALNRIVNFLTTYIPPNPTA